MNNRQSIRFSLSLISLAAFTGLIGFLVVYHYATFERQLQHFAIVIDAGSTQTRSNLFSVELDLVELTDWPIDQPLEKDDDLDADVHGRIPLSEVFRVRQLSSCVNGAPLTSLKDPLAADHLVERCVGKFTNLIKGLEFDGPLSPHEDTDIHDDEKYEQIDRLKMMDGRLNSVTHLHLGATAGMRAMRRLNETKALEKIDWIDKALNRTSQVVSPAINKGFVGIISGADEAAFGWTSVNFVCEALRISRKDLITTGAKSMSDDSQIVDRSKQKMETLSSVGTVELGGNSAQMAYEVDRSLFDEADNFTKTTGLHLRDLNLFNKDYHLAYRSDLCLGMSQAILRFNQILLRDSYEANELSLVASETTATKSLDIELENPCLQNGSRLVISGKKLADILSLPCLAEPGANNTRFKDELLELIGQRAIEYRGSGEAGKCFHLLGKLIDPSECQRYFAICPESQNLVPPPRDTSFVTVSGYNKALKVLNLEPDGKGQVSRGRQEQGIARKLGGHSIDHRKFAAKIAEFCSVKLAELGTRYPSMNPAFHTVNCLQLNYIHKMLTDFYKFTPHDGSWSQVKFLLFPVEGATKAEGGDIGWTLGLLLNATSQQMSAGQQVGDHIGKPPVWYHHGSSVAFIIRATIFLMVACIFMALSLITIASMGTNLACRRNSGRLNLRRSLPPNYNTNTAPCCVSVPETKSFG